VSEPSLSPSAQWAESQLWTETGERAPISEPGILRKGQAALSRAHQTAGSLTMIPETVVVNAFSWRMNKRLRTSLSTSDLTRQLAL
jgi:hypothetical protein